MAYDPVQGCYLCTRPIIHGVAHPSHHWLASLILHHMFFSDRIFGYNFSLSIIYAQVDCPSGGGVCMSVIMTLNPQFSSFPQFLPELITWLASAALCDTFITICLVYSLVHSDSPLHFCVLTCVAVH